MEPRRRQHIDTVIESTVGGAHAADKLASKSLDAAILHSWQRCVSQYSLDPARTRSARIVTSGQLRVHQERAESLTRIARHAVLDLYRQIAAAGYIVLLADQDGIAIDYLGDDNRTHALREAGLYMGAEWLESVAGTNAVGTVLATGSALTVHQRDHFDVTHIPLTCTAAPVFDSGGRIGAVLNISALTSPVSKASQRLALELVKNHARRIEDILFLRTHRHDWIVKLATVPDFVDAAPDGLLALDVDGRIVGCNSGARQLFMPEPDSHSHRALRGESLLGLALASLFDLPVEHVGRYVWSGLPAGERAVELVGGGHRFVGVQPPQPPPRPAGVDVAASMAPAFAALSGGDPALDEELRRATRLADASLNVLLHGETGVGKEYFARALHAASARSQKPFVAVNCAAIPESLIESELFGYLPGSFSGASRKGRPGVIREADGGTLFLDEIGDMPYALQSRLLRVLAEREVVAVGATRPVPVDLRVVSASHRRLDQLVEEGRFRADLLYRLNGAMFTLPPLRERSDFNWLVYHLLGDRARITTAAMARLTAHGWPGNLRELTNTLEYASVLTEDGVIRPEHLPRAVQGESPDGRGTAPSASPLLTREPAQAQVPAHVDIPAREALVQLLRACGWNVSAAARQLKVSRMTVYRRMEKYGIESPNRRDFGESG